MPSKRAWLPAILLTLPALVPAIALPPAHDFIVHSISVQHTLGGAIQETTQQHVLQWRELHDQVLSLTPPVPQGDKYYLALTGVEAASLAHSEVNLQSEDDRPATHGAAGHLVSEGTVSAPPFEGVQGPLHLYSIWIPHDLLAGTDGPAPNLTVAIHLIFHKLSEPLPKAITQSESASLALEAGGVPLAIYGAEEVVTTVKCTTSRMAVTLVSGFSVPISPAGDSISIGPFSEIPPLTTWVADKHPRLRIQFQDDKAVLSIVDLERHVEVSHWGDSLSVKDRIWMRNDGPTLKGHFSRLEYRQQAQLGRLTNNIVRSVQMSLPPGARDVYFIDDIGNVSTSTFRPSAPDPEKVAVPPHKLPYGKAASLDIVPRYPLLGGWNYTFTVGYTLPLSAGGWSRLLPTGSYSLAVPFWTALPKVPVEKAKTRIVLPEGATLLRADTPFEAEWCSSGGTKDSCLDDSPLPTVRKDVYTSYLDTSGRPSLILAKSKVGEHDAGIIYIAYSLDARAHFRKPLAVACAVLAVFSLTALRRRVWA